MLDLLALLTHLSMPMDLAFGAFSFDVARALSAGSHKESLILDSWATDYIFTEREHFVE